VFTARYALSPYIKQISFVFKGLMLHTRGFSTKEPVSLIFFLGGGGRHGVRTQLAALRGRRKFSMEMVIVAFPGRCKSDPSLCSSCDAIISFHSLACCQDLLALNWELGNASLAFAMNMDKFKYVQRVLRVHWALHGVATYVQTKKSPYLNIVRCLEIPSTIRIRIIQFDSDVISRSAVTDTCPWARGFTR
jgi:hypothetical protein